MLLCMDEGTLVSRETIDYDAISDTVRAFCADRLYDLERSLRPLVDGSFGEVLPGHLNGYLGVLRELAKLYEAHKRPRDAEALVPVGKVQQLLAAAEDAWSQRLEQAVQEAKDQVRMEIAGGQQLSIQAAKDTVSSKLTALSQRA